MVPVHNGEKAASTITKYFLLATRLMGTDGTTEHGDYNSMEGAQKIHVSFALSNLQ